MSRRTHGLVSFAASLLSVVAYAEAPCCPVTPETLAWSKFAAQARATLRANRGAIPPLPPAPAGVTDLTFTDFFGPIGDRGLEYSAVLQSLHGHRVRIAGFMVNQQSPALGLLLLTATPHISHEAEFGLCDDLPAATLHVIVPSMEGRRIPLGGGPLVLTGRLEVGPRAEADGRNSVARLFLDAPAEGRPLLPSAYSQNLALR